MPGKPRAGRVAPRWELTSMQLYQLGAHSAFNPDERLSAADLPHAWASVRGVILRKYAEQCPGNRPWAWWLLEAPIPRQCVVGGHVCLPRERILQEHKGGQLWYGKPGVYACPHCWGEVYESQARYLRRNGLLLPWEEGVVPITPGLCDKWAWRQYHMVVDGCEVFDDTPHPWTRGHGLQWCAAVLSDVGG